MKRLLVTFIFLCTFFLFPVTKVNASSTQAYQDYLYQFDQYRSAYNNFSTAKSEYLKYKTLLSETTALDTTETMMTKRTQLLTSYLKFLSEKINENKGLTDAQKAQFSALIQSENTFLTDHASKILTIASLTDATTISKDLESHYGTFQTSVRQIIIGLSLGDLTFLNQKYQSVQPSLQQIVTTNGPYVSPQKQETINRWMNQITGKETTYQQTLEAITTNNIPSPKNVNNNTDFDGLLTNAQTNLATAKQQLSDGVSYMQELLRLLQYQE